MTLFTPQIIKSDIKTMMNAVDALVANLFEPFDRRSESIVVVSDLISLALMNIKTVIKLEQRAIAVGEKRCSRIEQSVIKYIISFLLLFSGFKNRSLSRRERNHPRNLEMVTLMTCVHPWMLAKIRVVNGNWCIAEDVGN